MSLAKTVAISELILERTGTIRAYELHNILERCQNICKEKSGTKMFDSQIQEWEMGQTGYTMPIVPDIYNLHTGKYWLNPEDLYSAFGAKQEIKPKS